MLQIHLIGVREEKRISEAPTDTFETSAVVVQVLLFGRWLEQKVKKQTTEQLQKLKAGEQYSTIIINNEEVTVHTALLEIGDVII